MRAIGADVSHWNPISDVAALAGAVSFIGLKASEGTSFVDPTFEKHIQMVRSQPFALKIFYHLARPGDGAAQAARFLALLDGLRPNERLALDTERTSAVDAAFIGAFFDALPRDRRPILYTSNGVWTGMRSPAFPQARDVDLWLPRYGSAAEPVVPEPWSQAGKSWTLWQTSQDAIVPGVDGPCDVSVFNGDDASLSVYAQTPALVA